MLEEFGKLPEGIDVNGMVRRFRGECLRIPFKRSLIDEDLFLIADNFAKFLGYERSVTYEDRNGYTTVIGPEGMAVDPSTHRLVNAARVNPDFSLVSHTDPPSVDIFRMPTSQFLLDTFGRYELLLRTEYKG